MKLGVNTYTYMWSIGFQGPNPAYPDKAARPAVPLSALGLLEKAHELGVSLVQTGPNQPLDRLPEPELERVIQAAREWGISFEVGTRGLDEEHVARQVALAKRLGATLIRTLPEIGGKYVRDARELPPVLRRSLPLLERENVRLAVETGRLPAAEFKAAHDEVNSPLVGAVLDTVNSLAVPEGWKYVAEIMAPHTLCLHYKDFVIKRAWHMMGFICEGAPAGQGQVDAAWLFNTLTASPYDFNVLVEVWTPELPNLEDTIRLEQQWAAAGVAYLRGLIPN
jgi:sugar phosphate isomerase/epimerase